MKQISLSSISIKDLAGLISSELSKNGVEVTLTGGACVCIYSNNKYKSFDLDFVPPDFTDKQLIRILDGLGFRQSKTRYFKNPDCPYFIEFVSPPLSIGNEPVKKIDKLRTKYGTLNILSPTDCVKDRLAAYYHWDDPQSLEQAILVAKNNKIDLKEIKRWSENEKMMDKFNIFINRIQK